MPSILTLLGGRSQGRGRRVAPTRPAGGVVIREPAPAGARVLSPSPRAVAPAAVSAPPEAVEPPATSGEGTLAALTPTVGGPVAGGFEGPRGAIQDRAIELSEGEELEPLQKRPRSAVSAGEGPSLTRPERGSDLAVPAAPGIAVEGLPLLDS